MANRTYPSYWLYKDNVGEWRWTYHASNGKAIAVASEGYKKRSDCERGIEIMKGSNNDPVWFPTHLQNAA